MGGVDGEDLAIEKLGLVELTGLVELEGGGKKPRRVFAIWLLPDFHSSKRVGGQAGNSQAKTNRGWLGAEINRRCLFGHFAPIFGEREGKTLFGRGWLKRTLRGFESLTQGILGIWRI